MRGDKPCLQYFMGTIILAVYESTQKLPSNVDLSAATPRKALYFLYKLSHSVPFVCETMNHCLNFSTF